MWLSFREWRDLITSEQDRYFEAFGGAREFVNYRGPEAIIHGPAETGKTISALYKLHIAADAYPNSSIVIARKTLSSCYGTVLQTFQNKVLFDGCGVEPYGGNKPEWFDYPNGSRIWIAGLDKASKILSAEHDIVYVNQAEELSLDDWETLTTRTTGRAGNMPYSQTIGDANPAWPTHWMYGRESLKLFYSQHSENPALFDQATGKITEQGERTMGVLMALTGLRRTRLLDGKAAQAEGVIYEEWHPALHLIDRFDIPDEWLRFRVVDFGYTNPFVCQWWAVDYDGRMYRYREIYHTGRTVRAHSATIREWSEGEYIIATVCDHDAEDRATLHENGIKTLAAQKAVSVGIDKVKERLKVAGDHRPRLYFLRDSLVEVDHSLKEAHKPTCTEDEFPSYVWGNSKTKEQPSKEDDHGMDATRYAVMYRDGDVKPPPAGAQADGKMHKRERKSRWSG